MKRFNLYRFHFRFLHQIVENMMVHKNIISPQASRPVMGIVQDTLAAVCTMTRRDTFIERAQLMTLLFYLPTWNGVVSVAIVLTVCLLFLLLLLCCIAF